MEKYKVIFFSVPPKEKAYIKRKLDKNKYDLEFYPEALTEDNADLIKEADAVSVFIYSDISGKVMSKGKKLKLIATRSTGFNQIDLDAAKQKGIAVANVPYYGENTVAEHTFALILSLSRNLHKAHIRTMQNNFSLEGLRGFDLKGKTLGVVGSGSIGVHVIKMAKGFDMNVLAYDVHHNHILQEILNYKYAELDELLANSDIITMHCPYNQATHHLINMGNVDRIKRGALFINTARAGLIEPEALYYGIEKGIFSGAGLDVFEGEDLVEEENQMLTKNVSKDKLQALLKRNLLLKKENVIITPHMAFDSIEAVERILDTTLNNIDSFFAKKKFFKVV